MRQFWVLVLGLWLAGAVQAAELSRKVFLEQFISALQAEDTDKISLLLQDNPSTAQQVQQALQAAKGNSKDTQQARALGGLLAKLRGAMPKAETADDGITELRRLNQAGKQAWNHSDYPAAIEILEQGLKLAQELQNQQYIIRFIGNLGLMYNNLSQYAKALEYYEQALAIRRDIGDRNGAGGNLTNIGTVYDNLGQYSKALEYYEQALDIHRDIGDRNGEGANLINIGVVHQNLGQYSKALEYYQQALDIHRDIGDRKDEGAALTNIGVVHGELGQYDKALEYYEQALDIERDIGDRKGEGITLTNIGNVYQNLGQYIKALEHYEQALGIHRDIDDRTGEGADLGNMAAVYETQGDYAKTRDTYQQALVLFSQTGEPENLWLVWKKLYVVLEKLNNPNAAIFYGKKAVNTIQTLRSHVAKLDDKSFNQSFLKDKKDVYKGLADLLIRQGRLFEAQRVLEVSHEGVGFTSPEQAWATRYAEISAQLVSLGEAYSLLSAKKRKGLALSAQESQRLQTLRSDLTVAEQALQAWFKDMDAALGRLKPMDVKAVVDF